jgi:hypothetical protein
MPAKLAEKAPILRVKSASFFDAGRWSNFKKNVHFTQCLFDEFLAKKHY